MGLLPGPAQTLDAGRDVEFDDLGLVVVHRHGDDVVLVPALVAVIAGVTATALAGNGVVLLVGAAFLGIGYGTLISAGQAFAIARVPRAHAGIAVASFFLVVDAGTSA